MGAGQQQRGQPSGGAAAGSTPAAWPPMTGERGGPLTLTGPIVSCSLPFVTAYQSAALDALGDPTRRAIFERLADGPRAVGELARELPVSRPAVSQHLKVLKQAGLVTARQEGTRRRYQLDPAGIAALRAWLDRFWDQALEAFKSAVEQPEEEQP
jgi:DNA-binding transcriptional ArsR family regulator